MKKFRMKKFKMLAAMAAVCSTLLMGCGNSGDSIDATGRTEISLIFGKVEVMSELEEMVRVFNNSQEDILVTIVPTLGRGMIETANSLYAANDAPTLSYMPRESMEEFLDRLLDLSGEPFEDLVMPDSLSSVRIDGKLLGMPNTVEGMGFIYNKTAIEEALGETFDPNSIRTRDALEEIFVKLEAVDGMSPIHISPMEWSLGNHFTNIFVASQSPDFETNMQFLNTLVAGNADLANNEVFQGWLETFELMLEYNSARNAPLDPEYDDGSLALADGDVGFWFMGNWAYPMLAEINPDAEFGFIPVPISNDPNDFGNNQLAIDVPQYWMIDASQSTVEEQEAAKEFLNWLATSEVAHDHIINKMNFIPIFSNMTERPEDPLSLSMLDFIESQNTLYWMFNYYPSGVHTAISAPMERFMIDAIDRDELIAELNRAWGSNTQQ